MVKVQPDPSTQPNRHNQNAVHFDPEAAEYYPSACCETLHVKNAVLAATLLQITFCILLLFLYINLDNNGFLRAVDICRTSMILLFFCNVVGLLCAFIGTLHEKLILVQVQTMILTSLVVLADFMSLCLVLIMAIGKRNYATASIPGIFIDTDRVEYVLGPFWIYLIAIGLHMAAAGTMCFIGVYNRYLKFLREKTEYTKISAESNLQQHANVITVNGSD